MIRILKGETIMRPDGSLVHWVHLIADDEPSSLAISGADVDGMNNDDVLAAGSTVRWPGGSAILYEDNGSFVENGSSGGSGGEPA